MRLKIFLLVLISILLLAGCATTNSTGVPTIPPPTTQPPTPTSVPMAIVVNGYGISMADYQGELSRLQMALTELNREMTPEQQQDRLVNSFVDELLLVQGAEQAGHTVSDTEIQARIDKLITDIGGAQKLTDWQAKFGYTDASFREYLKRSILVSWQRDQIIDSVPMTAEQIHARQILYQDEANANDILVKLQNGAEFATLAKLQDPTLGGDLGWFPRGTLTQPVVEEAAFALQPGETSVVIKSDIGFHIINVIERDEQHPLSVDARRRLQEQKLAEWLDASRAVSTIEILLP